MYSNSRCHKITLDQTSKLFELTMRKGRKKRKRREKRKEKKSMIIVVPSCLKDADGARTRSDQLRDRAYSDFKREHVVDKSY